MIAEPNERLVARAAGFWRRLGAAVIDGLVVGVASLVSAIAILIGYLWMLWDGNRQTWHDKAAGSLPVYERG